MSSVEPNPETGKLLPVIGSYRLLQQLGSGGMSSVFRAVHVTSDSVVAVKILPRRLAQNPTLLQRFLNEAKNAERLQHPNIVAIFDRGFDQGRYYLVLEFVAGGDLQDRVRNEGPLPVEESVLVVREIAEGLKYAAKRGVIHRDIKPANLLASRNGHVKIIDLGLAVESEAEDERVTRDGTTVGTVDYMSPEQARNSRATSEASDIYSLGCTFFYLLTGAPPYPGGDIVDKLGRHCTAPIPDVRTKRPEVPESLALLIKRMMAKKPLQRFASHGELLAALGALPIGKSNVAEPAAPPLMALLVDEDEVAPPSIARFADDLDGDLVPMPTLPPTRNQPSRHEGSKEPFWHEGTKEPSRHEGSFVSIGDLADLDQIDEPPPRRKTSPSSPRLPVGAVPTFSDDIFSAVPTVVSRSAGPGLFDQTTSLKTFIGIGVAIGLAIALVGFGLIQLFGSLSRSGEGSAIVQHLDGSDIPDERSLPLVNPNAGKGASAAVPTEPPDLEVAGNASGPWVEPVDIVAPPTSIIPRASSVESKYLPEWARSTVVASAEMPVTIVKRADEGRGDGGSSTLRQGMARPTATLGIADDGPFFESDWKILGKTRVIRAAPGFRPMLVLQASDLAAVRGRPAPFSLDGQDITLLGVDLVVDAKSLPNNQTSLFSCRGGSLRLLDCTVTILNPADRALSLIQIIPGEAGRGSIPTRVLLQNTFVRGPIARLVDLGNNAAEVVLDRCLIQGESGPLFLVQAGTTPWPRRLFLVESQLAAKGSIVEIAGSAAGVSARVYRSTLAKADGADPVGLVHFKVQDDAPGLGGLNWQSEECRWIGWSSLVTSGPAARPKVRDLAALRLLKPVADQKSETESRPWNSSATRPSASPADLVERPSDPSRPTLRDSVARPTPWLLQKTVDAFDTPTAPTLTSLQSGEPTSKSSNQGSLVVLSFNADDRAEANGDLGLFLRRHLPATGPGTRVRVVVKGVGPHFMTPVLLPEGFEVEIVCPTIDAGRVDALTWTAAPGASGEGLFRIRGGSLRLVNLILTKGSQAKLDSLVEVEDGDLVLDHCQFASGPGADGVQGSLVLFRTSGTQPLPPSRPTPFEKAPTRPTLLIDRSVLLAHHDAISTDLSAGRLFVSGSFVLSESGAAFALRPRPVSRSRFDSDVSIDRSTIVAGKTFVRLGSWTGAPPGPDRPLVFQSRKSLYIDSASNAKRDAALLRADARSLAHDVLFWQAEGDTYDLSRFKSTSDLATSTSRDRSDFRRQWVDFWGESHIKSCVGLTGRGPGSPEPSPLRFASKEHSKGSELIPGDFALDPKSHTQLGADFRSLPLVKGQIRPPAVP